MRDIWNYVFLISFVIGVIICLKNVYVFLEVKKHKTHFFFFVGLGAGFKFRFIRFCIAVRRDRHKNTNIYFVKRNRRFKKSKNVKNAKPMDPNLVKTLIRNIKIAEGEFNIRLGAGEADKTALLCGSLWIILSSVFSFSQNHVNLNKIKFDISPEYSKKMFWAHIRCILKIDLANIIIKLLKLLTARKRKKEKAVLRDAPN